jgi:hypothetical protein
MAYRFYDKPRKFSAKQEKELVKSFKEVTDVFQSKMKPLYDFQNSVSDFYKQLEENATQFLTPVKTIEDTYELLRRDFLAGIVEREVKNVFPNKSTQERKDILVESKEIVEEGIINTVLALQKQKNKTIIFRINSNGRLSVVGREGFKPLASYKQINLLRNLKKVYTATEILRQKSGLGSKDSVQQTIRSIKLKALQLSNNATSLIEGHQILGYRIKKGCQIKINSKIGI